MDILTTTKVTKDTLQNAKRIAAETGEKQYQVIDRAVKELWKQIKKTKK